MLRMILERAIQMQKDVYLHFIDYAEVFDKVWHTELFELLGKFGLFWKDMRIIYNILSNSSAWGWKINSVNTEK